jgi:hypothetical protein
MKDILFEDLYAYANKWHKDAASRSARPITKTLNDIAKNHPDEVNKPSDTFIPHPGTAIVEALGNAMRYTSDSKYLIAQLFDNPSVTYDKETVEKVNNKLKNVWDTLKSISNDLDKNDNSDS